MEIQGKVLIELKKMQQKKRLEMNSNRKQGLSSVATFSTIVWLFENTEGKDDVIQNSSGDYLQSIKPTLI